MNRNLLILILVILAFAWGGPYYYGGERGPYYGGIALGCVWLVILVLSLLGVRL